MQFKDHIVMSEGNSKLIRASYRVISSKNFNIPASSSTKCDSRIREDIQGRPLSTLVVVRKNRNNEASMNDDESGYSQVHNIICKTLINF